jgi:hypothetical protein
VARAVGRHANLKGRRRLDLCRHHQFQYLSQPVLQDFLNGRHGFLLIDENTSVQDFRDKLRWNDL